MDAKYQIARAKLISEIKEVSLTAAVKCVRGEVLLKYLEEDNIKEVLKEIIKDSYPLDLGKDI